MLVKYTCCQCKKVFYVEEPVEVYASQHDIMFTRVRLATDEELENIWEALRHYDPKQDYVPGIISMDTWAQTVYSEMDKRGIPHIIPRKENPDED